MYIVYNIEENDGKWILKYSVNDNLREMSFDTNKEAQEYIQDIRESFRTN